MAEAVKAMGGIVSFVAAARLRLAIIVGLCLSMVTLGAPAARAAEVDLVVNIAANSVSYWVDEAEHFTTTVENRGSVDTTGPSVLTVSLPHMTEGAAAWDGTVTCVAAGGAVCPASFTVSADRKTLTGTIPAVPTSGKLTIDFVATPLRAQYDIPGSIPGSYLVQATVSTGSDAESQAVTDTSGLTLALQENYRYAVDVTGPVTLTTTGPHRGLVYTVVVRNTGNVTEDLYVNLNTGFETAPITGLTCVGATGGASCANYSDVPITPPVSNMRRLQITSVPAGGTVSLEVLVDWEVLCGPTGVVRYLNVELWFTGWGTTNSPIRMGTTTMMWCGRRPQPARV